MNKIYKMFTFVMFIFLLPTFLCMFGASPVDSQTRFFRKIAAPLQHEKIITDPYALVSVTKDALRRFNGKDAITQSKIFSALGFHTRDIERTLRFIIKTIEEDELHKRPSRINNPEFINKHFDFIQWRGDAATAERNKVVIPQWPDGGTIKPDKIRLTCYAAFTVQGRPYKTNNYQFPLYELVGPEAYTEVLRRKYTKQEILDGALDNDILSGMVRPLVWLTRDGLEDALMQGSVAVEIKNKGRSVFHLTQGNNIPFNKQIKDSRLQKRYFYFKEIAEDSQHPLNHAYSRLMMQHGALFAGNYTDLGFGKLILIRYKNPKTKGQEIRLGVLADTGSAFKNNLYQLDLYAGIFKQKSDFYNYISALPNTTQAYMLIKKKAQSQKSSAPFLKSKISLHHNKKQGNNRHQFNQNVH